jgi:hypothetical protein
MMQLKMPLFATLISYTPAPPFVKDFLREDGSFVLQHEGIRGHCAPSSLVAKTVPQNSPLSPCE